MGKKERGGSDQHCQWCAAASHSKALWDVGRSWWHGGAGRYAKAAEKSRQTSTSIEISKPSAAPSSQAKAERRSFGRVARHGDNRSPIVVVEGIGERAFVREWWDCLKTQQPCGFWPCSTNSTKLVEYKICVCVTYYALSHI